MAKERFEQRPDTSPLNWRYLVWILLLLMVWSYWVGTARQPGVEQISYTEFKQEVRQGNVESVTFRGQNITGTYKQPEMEEEQAPEGQIQPPGEPTRQFTTVMPELQDPELMNLLEEHAVTIHAQTPGGPWWAEALIGILPWVLLIGLIFYASYRMQQRMMGGGGMFSFGKSKAQRYQKGMTEVTFDDVAGLDNAKRDLREIVGFLKEPERYRSIGAKVPRGILLMGPPGTGKTLLSKAVAGEAEVPFFSISGSEFIEMFVGVGASRVRDMFKHAKEEAPAIIFIDELDSVGRSRGTGVGGGHDEREQTLNQILNEMDGFAPHENVIVLAATNRPDVLDPALLRPGRFDRKVTLDMPDRGARQKILEVHTREVPLADDVGLETVAARTVGFSGADLENLVNEAALLAGREHKDKVDMASFDQARDKIVLGAEREGLLNDEEKKLVAFHESGHALMAWLLPEADPLDKVTIVPRGRALGATEQTPREEHKNVKRSYLLDRLGVMLGGRAAEKVVFGDITSGAESDLKQATQLARKMVCQWGMSETLGPVTFRQGEEHVFLGREMAQQRDFSEHTAELIDDEIRNLIGEREEKSIGLIEKHRQKLEALAHTLLEKETVEADEVERIFKQVEKGTEKEEDKEAAQERVAGAAAG